MSVRPAKSSFLSHPDAGTRIEEVDFDAIETIREMNVAIFDEVRIINTFDREDLMMLIAWVEDRPAGFKVGYRENRFAFYSAKGGVLPEYRRQGLARQLLLYMMEEARRRGYVRLTYDTFPNRDRGMTILGLNEGFRVVKADFNKTYKDWRLRLEKRL
ncbi:MAG: GNAT family N-acetyltransferase [Rhodothermales bacterium]